MERTGIIKAVCEWQEANDDKRAVIILAIELTGQDETHKQYSLSAGLAGSGENIVAMLKGAFKDNPDLVKLVHRAVKELSAEKAIKNLCEVATEMINETKEEEQK